MKTTLKKLLALFMAALMLMTFSAAAFAEETEEEEYVPTAAEIALANRPAKTEPIHITVGNPTKVNGSFFTTQFGNNTSDIDVRTMLHGYTPIVWDTQLDFIPDPMVVTELSSASSEEGTVYTISLADDLTYNDGETRITAADYAFSFLMLSSKEFSGLGADTGAYAHVVGWDEYTAGETNVFAGVRILDELRFTVTVKPEYEPYFYELSYLHIYPYPISVIAPGCQVKDDGDGIYIDGDYTTALLEKTIMDPDTGYLSYPMLSCGPYALVSYDRETGTVEFAANEYYKGNYEGLTPFFDGVTLVKINADTMIQQAVDGELDILNKAVDGDAILEGMANTDVLNMYNYARLGYGFLTYSCEKGPQSSLNVRQAVACCFDADTFVQEFLKSFGMPVYGYYGLGQWMTQAAMGNLRPEGITEEEEALWDEITLDELDHYDYDLERAVALLEEDGWTLNAEGEAFVAGQDTLRYKKLEDGSLMALSFDFAHSLNNIAADMAVEMLQNSFAEIGGQLVVEDVTLPALLQDHYREGGVRKYDMCFMATNFVSTFDPYMTLVTSDDYHGAMNTSAIDDQELRDLAWDMHKTEPGAYLTYMQRWLAFQKRYNEILPTYPIYSNVYFDFTSKYIQNYPINGEANWPTALLYAYWAEPAEEEEELLDEGEDEFEDAEEETITIQ